MKLSIEQICRDVLETAIREAVVSPSKEFRDPDPQVRTAGELAGVANRLAECLAFNRGENDDCSDPIHTAILENIRLALHDYHEAARNGTNGAESRFIRECEQLLREDTD